MIADKWKLNEVISTCIGSHHELAKVKGDIGQKVALVALGNMYTNIFDHGYAGNPFPREADVEKLRQSVNLTPDEFCGIGERVIEEIRKAEVFLNL